MCIKQNCILMHQFELKMKEQFLKSVIEVYGMVTFFSSQTVTWSSEDACTLFCPGHLIFKLSCVQLHQMHCLFDCPALTTPSSDLCLPDYCCQHFCLNIWVCFLAEHSFPPAHPIALEVRVVLAEHAACACCTSWPT